MKKPLLLLVAGAILALSCPTVSQAAKDPDKKAAKQAIKAVLKQYDTNGNGVIDGDEKDVVRKAYEADQDGPLKRFDTNNDGKLDDGELAAIQRHNKKNKPRPEAANGIGAADRPRAC
jgi:Ca2+-binding EF-hand superfamily protein